METSTVRRYYTPRAENGPTRSWSPRTTSPEDRKGIAVSVAINNVFGNLTFPDLLALTSDSKKLDDLVNLIQTLAQVQLDFVNKS